MAEKLLIILMNTDPTHPAEIATPLFQATVAASMEHDVEIVLTGRTVELAKAGFAETVVLQQGRPQSVYDLIREAHQAGVVFKACPPALEEGAVKWIPEIDDTVGSAYLICEAMADGTVTFTY